MLTECLQYGFLRDVRSSERTDTGMSTGEGSGLEPANVNESAGVFFAGLLQFWNLSHEEGAALLGITKNDPRLLKAFLAGKLELAFRDWMDRIEYLFNIRMYLSGLFRNGSEERKWLREKLDELDGKSPLETMRSGRFVDLLRVYSIVRVLCNI